MGSEMCIRDSYMSAQGSLAAFVILIFWFANKQEKIDDEHGYGGEREDD